MQYERRLIHKTWSALCENVHFNKQHKSHDFERLSTQKSNTLRKYLQEATQDQSQNTRKAAGGDYTSYRSNQNRNYFGFDTNQIRDKSARFSPSMGLNGSDKENTMKSEPLSFIEDFPEKESRQSVIQARPCLVPLDMNIMNRSMDKGNVSPTFKLGKLMQNNEENKLSTPNSVDLQYLQGIGKSTTSI